MCAGCWKRESTKECWGTNLQQMRLNPWQVGETGRVLKKRVRSRKAGRMSRIPGSTRLHIWDSDVEVWVERGCAMTRVVWETTKSRRAYARLCRLKKQQTRRSNDHTRGEAVALVSLRLCKRGIMGNVLERLSVKRVARLSQYGRRGHGAARGPCIDMRLQQAELTLTPSCASGG
eukprot:6180239-Pleurochrysis_carterae.AAC.1